MPRRRGVERGDRLAARKDLSVWVGPVRGSESFDVGVEAHAVDVGSWVVLSETRFDLDRQVTERRRDRLCSFDRPGKVAGDQHVGSEFAGGGDPLSEPSSLLATQLGQSRTGSVPADDPVDRDVRLAVPNEYEGGRRIRFTHVVGGYLRAGAGRPSVACLRRTRRR